MGKKNVLPISIIIPTYCEEKWLPILLKSIKSQVLQPSEIIVADALSTDKTRDIAKKFGAKVVDGGIISVGRNNGAKAAKNEYLLFMDADTELPTKTALFDAFIHFIKNDFDVASAHFDVNPKRESNKLGTVAGKVIWGIANSFRSVQQVIQRVYFEGGAFIMVKSLVFKHIGGFDEKMTINEDPDFYKRAIKLKYKYGHIPVKVVTSSRRFDTPKKLGKMLMHFSVNAVLIGAGLYAGSKIVKNTSSRFYGKLGGGEGKDIKDD